MLFPRDATRRSALIAVALGAAAAAWIFADTWRVPHFDDAFITYVFARHLSDGLGVVWVPGEPVVFGTSSPLDMLLLAGAHRAGADLITASTIFGVIGWSGAIACLFLILTRRVPTTAAAAGAVLAIVLSVGPRLSVGMETGMYVCLVLAACAAYDAGRERLAFLIAAAAVIARPDGVLIGAVLLAHHLFRDRRRSLSERLSGAAAAAWPGIAVLASAGALAFVYFGRIVPETVTAKSAFGCDVSGCFSSLGLFTALSDALGDGGALLFLAAALIGVARSIAAGMPLGFWIAADFIAFAYGGAPDSPWYYAALMVPLAGAVTLAVAAPVPRAPVFVRRVQTALSIGIAAVVALMLWPSVHARVMAPAGPRVDAEKGALVDTILGDMRERRLASAHVLAYEVGYVGYAIPGRVEDLLGLVTPSFQPCLRGEDGAAVLARINPDYILIVDEDLYRATGCIHRAATPAAGYDVIASRPTPYGMHYLVYRKRAQARARQP